MTMNRVGRIPFLILLSGALLYPLRVRAQAQDKQDQEDAPATKQQDSGKKKDANAGKKNLAGTTTIKSNMVERFAVGDPGLKRRDLGHTSNCYLVI